MRGIDFRSLFLAALAAFTLTPAFAAAQAVVDTDMDGIPDAQEDKGCVDETQRGLDAAMISHQEAGSYGCYVSTNACVAARLLRGGNSMDCTGETSWSFKDLELFRIVPVRQRRDGTPVPVSGNSVMVKGAKLTCADPASFLYKDGKVTDPDGKTEASAFGPEQPPFCLGVKMERRAAVQAQRHGVSREQVKAAIKAELTPLAKALRELEGEAKADGQQVADIDRRLKVVESYFTKDGEVAKALAEAKQDAKTAKKTAEEAKEQADANRARLWSVPWFEMGARASINTWIVANKAGVHPRYGDYVVNIQPMTGLDLGVLGLSVQPNRWLMVRAGLYGRVLFTSRIAAGSAAMGLGAGGDVSALVRVSIKPLLALGLNLTAGGDVRNVAGIIDSAQGAEETVLASPTGYVTPAFQALLGTDAIQLDGRIGVAGNWAPMPDGSTASGASLFGSLGVNFRFGGTSVQKD